MRHKSIKFDISPTVMFISVSEIVRQLGRIPSRYRAQLNMAMAFPSIITGLGILIYCTYVKCQKHYDMCKIYIGYFYHSNLITSMKFEYKITKPRSVGRQININ